jgi:hypothetical protein
LRRINAVRATGHSIQSAAQLRDGAGKEAIMQIQSRALPRRFSLWNEFHGLGDRPAISHSLLIYASVVLLLFLAIVEVDLHSAQLQALGLLGHATGIDPIFMGP